MIRHTGDILYNSNTELYFVVLGIYQDIDYGKIFIGYLYSNKPTFREIKKSLEDKSNLMVSCCQDELKVGNIEQLKTYILKKEFVNEDIIKGLELC